MARLRPHPVPAAIRELSLPPLMVGPGTDLGHRLGLSPRTEPRHWLAAIVLLPLLIPLLMLIGLMLILVVLGSTIALVIPRSRARILADLRSLRHRVDVETDRFPVYPGEEIDFVLLQPTRPRLHGLSARLVGTEVAQYRQGTNTETTKHVFCTIDAELQEQVGGGDAAPPRIAGRVRVPEDAMHSFAAKHNQIAWAIEVERSFGGSASAVTRRELLVCPTSLPWPAPFGSTHVSAPDPSPFQTGGVAA